MRQPNPTQGMQEVDSSQDGKGENHTIYRAAEKRG